MIKFIDEFLNRITMYRLMLYVLIFLVGIATILGFFKVLPFHPLNIIFSAIFLVITCLLINTVLSKVFKVPTNIESVYITALILALILTPLNSVEDLLFYLAAAIISQSSKYLVAVNRKHLFNPAAFAVVLTALIFNFYASWWVGTIWMVPFTIIGGVLIAKKVQRFSLILSFLFTALSISLGISILQGNNLAFAAQNIIFATPILFFAFVMLTEPLTTPPTKLRQILYGGLVGIGFSQAAPEIALLIGNIFSYIVSPKEKLLLKLKEKVQLTPDIYDFVFSSEKRIQFQSGQYLEWTLGHQNPDNRGNRRYFTIASSPTEKNLRIGVKFYPDSSTFKKRLISLPSGEEIIAGQLAGEFTLPQDTSKKLCFLAGGIGITPFRSMIKYLLDTNQKRNIILLYSTRLEEEIVYKEILDEAFKKLGIKTFFIVTQKDGYLDNKKIQTQVPDYKERIFYISGPHSMVDVFEKVLEDIGISRNQIKVDFFPGYA